MESKIIKIGGEQYQFKFGLKGLIYLAENLNIERKDIDQHQICYAGMLVNYPDIQMSKVEKLPLGDDFLEQLSDIFDLSAIPSPQTIEEWYKKGIGEMSLPITTFYCLTPHELDIVYEGYLRRQELLANLIQLSILQTQNPKPIKIFEESNVHTGSLKEREETFLKLGIQEV